ncbi:MAG: M56 family metallopeptidase [Clostridia bacterium]|nr:M56 family metallopeptidase [Clostridia bacterium]
MEAVFTTILNMSASSCAVIIAVIIARFVLGAFRAPKKWSYALWIAAAFRLLCPVSFKAAFSIFRISPKPAASPVTAHTTALEYAAVPAAQVPPSPAVDALSAAPAAADPVNTWMTAGALVWLIGMAALVIYAVISYMRLLRRVSGAVRLYDNVYAADIVSSPFIMGFFRPRIYVPFGLLGDTEKYVLEHERYHIKRGDHVIKCLAFLILAVHWFNPLVWLAFYLMSRDMEMSCDEKVLGESAVIKKAYGMALLSFASGQTFSAAGPLSFGETGVKGRIKNALRFKKPKAWVTVTAAALCIAVVAACAANPPTQEKDGRYESVEAYILSVLPSGTVRYTDAGGGLKTANITDVRIDELERQGELSGLAKDGTLEAWHYLYRMALEAPEGDIALVGGMNEWDGYYDLEGQGGHIVVALRRDDASYEILSDEPFGDGVDFYGMHGSVEESLYDWYVSEYGLDLPLYIKTEDVKSADGETQKFALRRYDGDGWYVYIPAQSWRLEKSEEESAEFVSLYNTGSKLIISKAELGRNNENPDEASVSGRKVRTVRSSDGVVWLVRADYDPETIDALSGENNLVGFEPELMRIMADSFTPDERFNTKTPETPEAALSQAIAFIEDKSVSVSLWLDYADKRETAAYSGRGVPNETQLSTSLSDFEYTRVGASDKSGECVNFACRGYAMKFFEDENTFVLYTPEGVAYSFNAEYKYGEDSRNMKLGTLMRSWYDEAEFNACGGFYDGQYNIIVPDRGQTHIEAAEEFCRIFEGRHTVLSDGSQFKFSFVKCDVREAAEETEHFRSLGRIGDDTWAFYVIVAFVPENERALRQSMAGNTGEYTGNDPEVPYGAFEYGRCGYATRADDGWHVELVGTGW